VNILIWHYFIFCVVFTIYLIKAGGYKGTTLMRVRKDAIHKCM